MAGTTWSDRIAENGGRSSNSRSGLFTVQRPVSLVRLAANGRQAMVDDSSIEGKRATMAEHFDLISLGGGSGGLAAAQKAALHGARCAVVESGRLGGTCVNVGCVPKKVMWHAADIAHALEDASGYGFRTDQVTFHWPIVKAARDAYIRRLNGIYARSLEQNGVQLIEGTARLDGAGAVVVGGERYRADHVVVATGGFPTIPKLPGAQHGITSDGFFELEELPRG